MQLHNKLLASAAVLIPLVAGACADNQNTMRIATHTQLENLDPEWTTAYMTRNHGYLVYDTLFAYDQNFEPKPQMVDTYTVSPDQKTWTFKLRPGQKWHDGTNVTAADCVASLQRWAKRDGDGQDLFKNVASLTAADDQTIVMQLSRPDNRVLIDLAKMSANVPFMMPKRIAETDPNTPITDATGSGPFIFQKDKWDPNGKAVYVRNPNYVPRSDKASLAAGGKVARAKEIDLVYYRDQNAAADALVKGDVDYLESPSTRLVPKIAGKNHVVIANTDPLGNLAMMRFNSQAKPFNNPAIRRAVLMTIHQERYMDAALGDKRFYRPCFSIYACGTTYASLAGAELMQKDGDLDAARTALKAAHYDGTPVVILNPSDNPVISAFTAVTAENLRYIGMNVEVRDMTLANMMQERTKGNWSLFHTWWLAGDVMDPSDIAYSGNAATGWPGAAQDAQLESLRLAFSKATSPDEKFKLAAKVQERVYALATLAPLGQFFEPVALRDDVVGVTSPIQFYWSLARATPKAQRVEGVPGEIKGQFFTETIGDYQWPVPYNDVMRDRAR